MVPRGTGHGRGAHGLKFLSFVSIPVISHFVPDHMSDASTVPALPSVAPNAAGNVVAHTNVEAVLHSTPEHTRTDITQIKSNKAEDTHDTSLCYSIDRDAGALRLKVSNSQGEVIRELTFTDFVSTMKSSSLAKGVLVDARS